MDSFDDQEKQAPDHFRGACFGCGLGVGSGLASDNGQKDDDTNTPGWQSDRPNPLPIFEKPNEFYTPILLPGMYLPLEFMSSEIDNRSPFHTIENPELAKRVAAFLDHEAGHRYLLVGVVPMLMRLMGSRCYAQLALLTTDGFHPSWWEGILSQSNNIDKLFMAIAPLHEVVAILRNFVLEPDNAHAVYINKKSRTYYNKKYGKRFTQVFRDFCYIIQSLRAWFAPEPIQDYTMLILAEFMLMGAIDSMEIRNDLFTSPPLIPPELLAGRIAQVGIPYFETDKQPPRPLQWNTFTYNAYDISERLREIKSGIKKTKPKRSKAVKTDVEQVLYIANAIPGYFHEWLRCMDILPWLRRRVLDGITDMQEMIKSIGFDLPLVEAWQADLSPYISITLPNKFANQIGYLNYGMQREHFFKKMYSQLDERHRQQMKEHIFSNNLIAFCLQSNRTVGMWYGPSCDKINCAPITPMVYIMSENNGADNDLVSRMFDLTVFESLRVQVGEGKGISCLLRHQYSGGCCGRAGLMWSIYEAGLKAMDIKELDWHPTKWVKPECSKPDNK